MHAPLASAVPWGGQEYPATVTRAGCNQAPCRRCCWEGYLILAGQCGMLGFLLRLADSNERPHFISIGFDWRRMAIVKKVTFLLDWPFLSPAAEKKSSRFFWSAPIGISGLQTCLASRLGYVEAKRKPKEPCSSWIPRAPS